MRLENIESAGRAEIGRGMDTFSFILSPILQYVWRANDRNHLRAFNERTILFARAVSKRFLLAMHKVSQGKATEI